MSSSYGATQNASRMTAALSVFKEKRLNTPAITSYEKLTFGMYMDPLMYINGVNLYNTAKSRKKTVEEFVLLTNNSASNDTIRYALLYQYIRSEAQQ